MHGDFTRLGPEHLALDADDVADIQLLEFLIRLDSHIVAAEIELQLPVAVRDMTETRLAHNAFGHQSARHGHVFVRVRVVIGAYRACGCGAVVSRDFKGVFARRDQFREFSLPDLADFAYVLHGLGVFGDEFAHRFSFS